MTTDENNLNLTSMHRYLKTKFTATAGVLDEHTRECISIVNAGTLVFFELTFKSDLERLGLINTK